jgi:ABC-type branched-subunit amino acid transport system substrate-binding protein
MCDSAFTCFYRQSAFQAALEVLNSQNRSYQIEAIIEDSSCNWMKVSSVAHTINQTNLIGIVGPACSGAALSAVQYLDPQIPIVSFAATHESLSSRSRFPNFFRTVYVLFSLQSFS